MPLPSYTYNDASDILTDGTKSYTYDGLARLIRATPSISGALIENYVYDKTGNRANSTLGTATTTYTTNTLDQYSSLSGTTNLSSTYDANGNIKTEASRTYTYDYNNRLIQVNSGASILTKYTYDILGRRTQKIDSSKSLANPESTTYIYNGDNIQSEYKSYGVLVGGTGSLKPLTLKKNYINTIGTDQIVSYDIEEQLNPTSTGKVTSRYYIHTNQLGSVVAITSSTGALRQKYSYDTYGKPYIINTKL